MKLKSFLAASLLLPFLFGVSDTASAETLSNENNDIVKEKHFRENFGLNSDINHIKNVMRNSNSEKKFGEALTDTEEKEIHRRIKIQEEDIPKIKNRIKGKKSIIYIDQKNSGKVKIGFKNINSPDTQSTIEQVQEEFGKEVGVEFLK